MAGGAEMCRRDWFSNVGRVEQVPVVGAARGIEGREKDEEGSSSVRRALRLHECRATKAE
jgi:hypothetical protein